MPYKHDPRHSLSTAALVRAAPSKLRLEIEEDASIWSIKTTLLIEAASQNPKCTMRKTLPRPMVADLQSNNTYQTLRSPRIVKRHSDETPPVEEPLSPENVQEIVAILDEKFPHLHFMVGGLTALTYYGFTNCAPSCVTISCAPEAVRIVKAWAKALSIYVSPSPPDELGIRTRDGVLRCVRITDLDEQDHSDSGQGIKGARVLSLPRLFMDLAASYMGYAALGSKAQVARYDGFLTWALREMKVRGQQLKMEQWCQLNDWRFMDKFLEDGPWFIDMLLSAGLDLTRVTGAWVSDLAPEDEGSWGCSTWTGWKSTSS